MILNSSKVGHKRALIHVCTYLDAREVVKLAGVNRNCQSAIFKVHVRPDGKEKEIFMIEYYFAHKYDPLLRKQLNQCFSCEQFIIHTSKHIFKTKNPFKEANTSVWYKHFGYSFFMHTNRQISDTKWE